MSMAPGQLPRRRVRRLVGKPTEGISDVSIRIETCGRCNGSGGVWVPTIPGDPFCRDGGAVSCPRCGGLGEIRPVTVRTTFLGATDTRGSRYRVTAEDGSRRTRTYSTDFAVRDMHETAALRFAGEVLGIHPARIDYADGRMPQGGYRFAIARQNPAED